MKKIIVILGPTSTGKTDLALRLAKNFDGELVACDSRQVYTGLDIGTGKLPSGRWKIEAGRCKKGNGFWEINGIKIWMYDVANPNKQYTVSDYVKDSNKVIDHIIKRGKLPIIVGGTGFYLKALLEGLPSLVIPVDKNLRKTLQKLSKEQLQEKLQEISPDRWEKMNSSDRQNPRRLVRAIEIVILSRAKDLPRMWDSNKLRDSSLIIQNDILKIGLTVPREILYQKIDKRVVSRIDQGMVNEAEKLHKSGLSFMRMKQLGLEYGVLADYLEGKISSMKQLTIILQNKIHNFARRQITWFKRDKNILWFDITDKNCLTEMEKMVRKWYDTGHAAKD